jgi:hypothetical protein
MGKQYYIIYETKNLKNGKIYIGMHETDDLEDGYLGSGTRLKRAIRYYGKEFFEKRILHIFDSREDMINKEIELVTEEFVNRKDTYNLMKGGRGGFVSESAYRKGAQKMLEKIWNDISFRKRHSSRISSLQKERWTDSEYREKMLKIITNTKGIKNGMYNKKHTEESKIKMKHSHSGSKNSQYGTCWITNPELKKNKKISKSELENYLRNGWIKGRKIK